MVGVDGTDEYTLDLLLIRLDKESVEPSPLLVFQKDLLDPVGVDPGSFIPPGPIRLLSTP